MSIEERLKEERTRLGYTQPDFAALAGRTKKTLIDYEKGATSPDARFLSAIAAVGADVAYILTGVRTAAPAGGGVYIADPRKLALLDNYEHATEEGQRAIERVALLESEAQHREVKAGRKRAGASREAA